MSNNKAFKVKNGLELADYNKSISDTAVDVFVYDTRKDSDGGAWRKRTQHTSWYNETLNTATRGSRKEFPAVAVIVAETNQVTIYDGDDPDLPMWFKSRTTTTSNGYGVLRSLQTYNPTCISALNGKLVVGLNYTPATYSNNEGVHYLDFLKDEAGYYTSGSTYGGRVSPLTAYPYTDITNDGTLGQIVDPNINDVAMTVLPNAPIDAATGLPVPTIAVATDGGVSVIKDDGTVVDITYSASVETVAINDNNRLSFNVNLYGLRVGDIPIADLTDSNFGELYRETVSTVASSNPRILGANSAGNREILFKDDTVVMGRPLGLTHLDDNPDAPETGMVAYTTSDYNTGWMNGDIKLATLSDTDATNVTGSELVTNGTFDTDTSGWTPNPNATLSLQSNELRVENSTNNLGEAYQAISLTAGVTYTFSANITAINTSHAQFFLGTGTTGTSSTVAGAQYNTTGVKSFTYTPTSSGTYYIILGHRGGNVAGYYAQYDNISARVAEEDRSVNNNGLQVFGTVTKSAVATGADLVAYSGFSSSNYLQQPHNTDLDFGTGDFCVMGWYNTTSTSTQRLFWREDVNLTGTRFLAQIATGGLIFYAENQTITDSSPTVNAWVHYMFTRKNGVLYGYKNGELYDSVSSSGDLTNTNANLYIGSGVDGAVAAQYTSIALFRISATAPTPEQIKKIYEDEKVLFQEGAQATLYGSSDAVTALAYDDSTNILSVGTSAGRSDFQGLRRVNNTTNAVGAAISASNGMIVEE